MGFLKQIKISMLTLIVKSLYEFFSQQIAPFSVDKEYDIKP